MKFNVGTISVYLAALAPLLAIVLALAVDRRSRKRVEKPPQEEKLLRPAGHSLAARLDETLDKFMFTILIACVAAGCAGASAVIFVQLMTAQGLTLLVFASCAAFAAFVAVGVSMTLRALRCFHDAQNIRLGLRGEQAVAEILHEIADCGFRAFHDFPGGDAWNIDHIAVGTRGVFLIETKARRRRKSRNGKPKHVVTCDGEALRFPTGTDHGAIPQAKRNAKHLSAYLTKKTGEPVSVEPLVVVPGWFVENVTGASPVKVMNATYLAGYLRREREKIDSAQVRRIIAAVDEKCRDVEF
jgi:hypothetical protein